MVFEPESSFDGTGGVSAEAAERMEEIRDEMISKSFVFIPGAVYRSLLLAHGASESDLQLIESGEMHAQQPVDAEPTMHFRQISFHRMVFETAENKRQVFKMMGRKNSTSELRFGGEMLKEHNSGMGAPDIKRIFAAKQPAKTQILKKEIASRRASGAAVFFQRAGTRSWNMPPALYSESSVPMALAKFNAALFPHYHHWQENLNLDSNNVINDQLFIKVTKTADAMEAEGTPEGIHQDGTEVSTVTLIERVNVKSGAESRIWALEQPTGNYCSDEFGKLTKPSTKKDFDWKNCLANRALLEPWDTIYFNDREVKHEVRSFEADFEGGKTSAHRSVIVNFIRKPLLDQEDKMLDDNGEIVPIV